MLASSRPLLLLSFSTKRGSTGDNLEIEGQSSLSFQGEDPLDSSKAFWRDCQCLASWHQA